MAEERVILRNTKLSAIEETTEGTAIAETANSAVLLSSSGAEFRLPRDLVENEFMTGSLSKTKPQAGMWGEDLGAVVPTFLRGKGTLAKGTPDWAVFMKSIMGLEETNTDGTADLGCTTDIIQIKTGLGDLAEGQLVYFPTQGEVSRVIDVDVAGEFQIWPPLESAPSEDDAVTAGTSWMLTSDDHPSFTLYSYFDGPKRLRLAGGKTIGMTLNCTVGQNVPVEFDIRALSPTYDNTAQAVTPVYDTATVPLMCLAADMLTELSATATGTPTQTETILLTPNFDVNVNDKIRIDVGSSVWETVTISAVSGNAGSNITLTHASVSVAANNGDTVHIVRVNCAMVGESLNINMTMGNVSENCMAATYGRLAREFTERTIEFEKTPLFKSWQEFLLRDAVETALFKITLGDTANNIVTIFAPALVNTDVALNTDDLMSNPVTARATLDPTLGNNHEFVIGSF